jgi:hypothetical protein
MVENVLNVSNVAGKNVFTRSVPMVDVVVTVKNIMDRRFVFMVDNTVRAKSVMDLRFVFMVDTAGYAESVTAKAFVSMENNAVRAESAMEDQCANMGNSVFFAKSVKVTASVPMVGSAINARSAEDLRSVSIIDTVNDARNVIHVSNRAAHPELNDLVHTVLPMVVVGDVNMGIMHHIVRGIRHVASDHPAGRIKKSMHLRLFTILWPKTTM